MNQGHEKVSCVKQSNEVINNCLKTGSGCEGVIGTPPPLEGALHLHDLAVKRQQSERNLQLCLHKSKEIII